MSNHIVLLILAFCLGTDGRVHDKNHVRYPPLESSLASWNAINENSLYDGSMAKRVHDNIWRSIGVPKPSTIPVTYPFVASLQILQNGIFSHLCGATIINELFLLTAAHCFVKHENLKPEHLFVEAGSNQVYGSTSLRLNVKAFKKHPDFYMFRGHDIALVQLATSLPIDNVHIGALNFRDTTRKGSDVAGALIGWGRSKPGKPKSIETVPFRTIKDETCYWDFGFRYLTYSEICAVNTAGPRGACDGDSGGPLVTLQPLMLYGVLSYGRVPCEVGKPYAFTRTSLYVKWIDTQMVKMAA